MSDHWSREEKAIWPKARQGSGEFTYSVKQAGIGLNGYSKMMKGLVMKKLLLLSVCLAFVGVAIAEEKPVNLLKSIQRSSWEIGPDVYYYQYKEPGFMKETGYFYGVQAAYTYREWVPMFPTDDAELKWMFRAEARYDWGTVNYDGALMDGTPYTYDNIRDTTGEFRLLIGPDFPRATAVDTIYAGLGSRFLKDNESGDPAGYDRQSHYVYLPIGFKTLRNLAGNWLMSANAEFDLWISGTQTTDLGKFGGPTIHSKQNSGYGLRGSLGFECPTKDVTYIIQPFVRYWNVAKSEVDSSGGYEPKNNTIELGLDLTLRF